MALGRGYARQRRQMLLALLVLSLACLSATATAAAVIKVWGAPVAALQALRLSQPELQWVSEANTTADDKAQLHLVWQQELYPDVLATGSRAPALVLSQQPIPPGRLRQQDAALIWGPPLLQQVQLARRLMPLAKRIGVLYREQWQDDYERLRHALADNGSAFTLVPLVVAAPLTVRAVAEAAEQVDVLIASNDDRLFNRDSAKLLLLTAYRHRRPVIGPTPAFVSAGAVATQAVPKAALLSAILNRVMRWRDTGRLGDSQGITSFAPVLNAQVARSLDIILAPDLLREVQP